MGNCWAVTSSPARAGRRWRALYENNWFRFVLDSARTDSGEKCGLELTLFRHPELVSGSHGC